MPFRLEQTVAATSYVARVPFLAGAVGVHSRVGERDERGYAAAGLGSQGFSSSAWVMASRTVRPWLRAEVR